MTWRAPDVERAKVPHLAGEREMLQAWLDFHRETLLWKCSGLTPEHLRTKSVPPSGLSLLGLVRHMAEVERSWFRRNFGGESDLEWVYCTDESPDGDFDDVATADPEADFATLRAEIAAADKAAQGHSLDETFVHPRRGTEMSLRWVYVHMIEEYARHNGHADFLRERIDGTVGE